MFFGSSVIVGVFFAERAGEGLLGNGLFQDLLSHGSHFKGVVVEQAILVDVVGPLAVLLRSFAQSLTLM